MTSSCAGPARSRPRAHRGCGRKGAPLPLNRSLILAKRRRRGDRQPELLVDPQTTRQATKPTSVGASKTNTFLGERYRRIARRRGKKKAIVAVGRSILVMTWYLLSDPEVRSHDLGSGYYDSRINPERKKRNHIRELEARGYKVTLQPAA
jgi:hypothetical protein